MNKKMRKEKKERIKILKQLGVNEHLCKRLADEEDFLLVGKTLNPPPRYDECKKLRREFEERLNVSVLFGILNVMCGCQILNLVFVSGNEEDWENERRELREGNPTAMAYNMTDDRLSDLGSIGMEINDIGYPVRIW